MHGAGNLQQLCMVQVTSTVMYGAGRLQQFCMMQVAYNRYI